MPVPSHTLLNTVAISNADQSSYTSTASYSPTADGIVHAVVCNRRLTSATPITPTLTGGGATGWSQVSTYTFGDRRLSWFCGLVSGSPTPAQLVLDFAGEVQTSVAYAVIEGTNITSSGTNGSDSIIQSLASHSASGTAVGGTLASAWAKDDNRALIAVWYAASGATVTWGTGFSNLASGSASGNSLIIGYGRDVAAGDMVIDGTLSGGGTHLFTALEINSLGSSSGGSSAPVVQSSAFRTRGMNGRFN